MTWFRLYHRILDDPDFLRLPDAGQAFWVRLLAAVSRAEPRGQLATTDHATIARLTCSTARVVGEYMPRLRALTWVRDEGESLVIASWDDLQCESDNVAGRVAKHRQIKGLRGARNVTGNVTANVTVTALDPDLDPDTDLKRASLSSKQAEEQDTGDTPDPVAPSIETAVPIPDDDERQALTLEAEDTRVRKANPLYETAMRVVGLHATVFGACGKPTQAAIQSILRCLGRNVGMSEMDCRRVVYWRSADEESREKGWTTLLNCFGNVEHARRMAGEPFAETARRVWFRARAEETLKQRTECPHPDRIEEQATIFMDMEIEHFGDNGRAR